MRTVPTSFPAVCSLLVAATLLTLVACGGSSPESPRGGGSSASADAAGCVEGRALSCSCSDGRTGRQVCNSDGTWSDCNCGATPPDAKRDAGSRVDSRSNEPTDTGSGEDSESEPELDTGTDTGSSASNWKTPYPDPPSDAIYANPDDVRQKIDALEPGDTLVLRDGTYPHIEFDGVQAESGARITIMAENERRALVEGDGRSAALRIDDSSYITVEGIRFENVDKDGSSSETFGAMPIYITGSDHITLWRNIARHPNLYGNNTAVKLGSGTSDSLLVENEVLDFHRNGIAVHNGPGDTGTRNNTLRRNYINPRDTRWKGQRWGPNYGIACYRGINTTVENNILEYSQESGEENRIIQNLGAENEFYGNIVIDAKHGFGHFYYDNPVHSIVMENNLVLTAKNSGLFANSVREFVARNNTFVQPAGDGFDISDPDDRDPEFTSINNLVIGAAGTGYVVQDAGGFDEIEIAYSGGADNDGGNWGPGTDSRSNVPPAEDPRFDGTYIHVPEDSPYAGAGRDGADVGADILYRYKNGELTDKPLWNPNTGEFPHGAVISGVNDQVGHSVFDIHKRLDVSPQTLPDDY